MPQEVATLPIIAYKSNKLVYLQSRLYKPENENTLNWIIVNAGNQAKKTVRKFLGISNSNLIKNERYRLKPMIIRSEKIRTNLNFLLLMNLS